MVHKKTEIKTKNQNRKKTSARVAINSYPYHAFGLHIPVWYATHVDTKGKPKNILHIIPQKIKKNKLMLTLFCRAYT